MYVWISPLYTHIARHLSSILLSSVLTYFKYAPLLEPDDEQNLPHAMLSPVPEVWV